ncbi:MAG: hypothetical protein NT103_05895 [Campylobacterales bacterium]|nr:hypothetical protein [Campylobacterales bacterium]
MKTLTLQRDTTPPSFSATTQNPALKFLLRMTAIFGVVMMFAVSGWGACGTSNGSWTPSATATTGSVTTTSEYYTITIASAGTLNISVQNTYTGSGTRTLTATLYPDNGLCSTTSAWSGTIVKNTTQPSGAISVSAGTYTLKLVSSSSSNTNYSLTGSFVSTPVAPIINAQIFSVPENSVAGTTVGSVTATNSPTSFTITGGTGQSLFDISNIGVITVKTGAVLNYEVTSSYTLVVKAANSAGNNSATMTIDLANILIPSITAGQSYTLPVGSANGTVVGTVATTVTTPTDFNITGTAFAISNTGVITVANNSGLVAGTYTVTVGASTSEGGDSKPITIVVIQGYSDLGLTNTDNVDPVITNASYTYTLGVSNAGPDTATGLVITDTLPVGVTYQSAVGTGWTCNEAGGLVVCTKPSLANGASSNVVITILAPVIGGTITNTATVISSGIDSNSANNTDIEQPTLVQGKADLKIIKTGPASAIVNNTIQYTLSVTNLGPSATDNVVVTDILPAGLGYQIYSGNDWICSYTSATRAFSCIHPTTLDIGTTSTITLVTTAPSAVPSPAGIINTATVTGPLTDPVSGNNTSSATTTITAASYSNPNVRPFALFRQDNFNGDVQMIGNSVMLVSGTPPICAAAGAVNNNLNTVYADKDGDVITTLNSTSADLVLPPKVRSADIQYAMLYWQGRTTGNTQIVNGKTVKIKPFGLASYQTVTSLDTKFNWTGNDYQGAVEVTTLIKNSLDAVGNTTLDSTGYNKPLWVGDVFANLLGSNSNGYGAWSLIIAYKDAAAKLRNISTYDGYDVVASGSPRSATLSGFLTPSSGAVDSKFLVFAGEGDSNYVTDQATLTNKAGTPISVGANTFQSVEDINGVNVSNRNPPCANTIGLDLRTFSVGTTGPIPIIQNSQTTTTVAMSSSQDQYFPGAFAFSTELYVPSVCYDESVTYNNFPVSGTNIPVSGNKVEYTVTIKNQDAEDAKGLFVEKLFDTPTQISYGTNSMQIAPIPGTTYSTKTDKVGDDTAEYSSSTTTAKFLLGSGAAYYQGGTLLQNQETKFKYKAKVGDQNVTDSGYKMSYRNDLLHLTFAGISAPKCTDFNNSFLIVVPPLPAGIFDAWETTIVGAPPAKDERKIYTKIVNLPTILKVGAMNGSDTSYQNYTGGLVGWRIVDSSTCPYGDDSVTAWTDINLSTINPNTITFTPAQANQDLQIQFAQKQLDGNYSDTKRNCSNDNFAIRPDTYTATFAPIGKLKAGNDFNLTLVAKGVSSVAVTGYNGSATISPWTQIVTCPVLDGNLTDASGGLPARIFNGIDTNASTNLKFADVGVFDMNVIDSTWTSVDSTAGECIADSNTSTVDADGKVGCFVRITLNPVVMPDHFDLNISVRNFNKGSFTYLSNPYTVGNDFNMSGLLDLNITAKNKSNVTTQNYNTQCYAKAKDINITYTPGVIPNLSNIYTHYLHDAIVIGDVNRTLGTNIDVAGVTKNIFTVDHNGSAELHFKINYDRNETRLVDKFDFNITKIDVNTTDEVNATTIGDQNITFVYGRVIPRDIRVFGNVTYSANAWYEVYNTPSIAGTVFSPSRNDALWYINSLHTDPLYGDANVTIVETGANPVYVTPNATNGVENYAFGAQTPPYSAKAHIDTDPWLWYGVNALPYSDPSALNLDCLTHPCFNINVVPTMIRSGSAKSTNESTKDSKSSTTGGAWSTTNDYAPAIR